jgi:FdhD protein
MLYPEKNQVINLENINQQTITVSATSFTPQGRKSVTETICRELPLSIYVNGNETATVLCSPADIEDLVFGILCSEGMVENIEDITAIEVDTASSSAWVKTARECKPRPWSKPLIATGGGKGSLFKPLKPEAAQAALAVSTSQIISLMSTFLNASQVYSATRGIHSAAVANPANILIRRDDIGRHNALDKVFGSCLRSGTDPQNHMVIISGRISSEMLLKVAARRSPVLLTKAVPTDLGISLAREQGITLARCSRDSVVTVYCHDWRITN